jgi:hypothetical protein
MNPEVLNSEMVAHFKRTPSSKAVPLKYNKVITCCVGRASALFGLIITGATIIANNNIQSQFLRSLFFIILFVENPPNIVA